MAVILFGTLGVRRAPSQNTKMYREITLVMMLPYTSWNEIFISFRIVSFMSPRCHQLPAEAFALKRAVWDTENNLMVGDRRYSFKKLERVMWPQKCVRLWMPFPITYIQMYRQCLVSHTFLTLRLRKEKKISY